MNIRDLEYFVQLSQMNSFTAVAKYFDVSQQTITYAIKRLEEQFGTHLFVKDPSHRSVILTQQGNILVSHAQHVLAELSIAQKEIRRVNRKEIRVGFPPIIRSRILSDLLKKGCDIDVLTEFQLVSQGSKSLLENITNGKLDFSLLGTLETLYHPDLIIKELYTEPFTFVLADDHPLAKRKTLSFEDVLAEPFILLDEGHVHMDLFNRLNARFSHQAKVRFKLSEPDVIGQMVQAGLGIGFLSDSALSVAGKNLVKVPLDDPSGHRFHVSYAYPKDFPLSDAVETFIQEIESL